MSNYHILLILSIFMPLFSVEIMVHGTTNSTSNTVLEEVHVGVILDMGSLEGRIVHSCITLTISDFSALNPHYKTRIILHTRDSKQDPFLAISSAVDLLDTIKVEAVLGPETYPEAKLIGLLGDKAKVPVISFSPSHYTTYPSTFQITQDETIQFKGIATLLDSFKWKSSILLYEDTDYGRDILPYLTANMHNIVYPSPISPSDADNQIAKELHKLMTMETSVYIVHMSPAAASHLFLEANKLGMMSSGYVWILTECTMSYFNSSTIKLMQGVLGIRSYVPPSIELRRFTSRWKRKFHMENVDIDRDQDPNVSGLLAYDTVWALAKAVETERNDSAWSSLLLVNKILQSRFTGLRGEFRTSNGRLVSEAFEIVNLIGRAERTVGFWTSKGVIVKDMSQLASTTSYSTSSLETVLWPGGSVITPRGWLIRMNSGKSLIIVVPVKKGFKELVDVQHDPQTNVTNITGFCIDVFKTAIDRLKYEVPFEFVPAEKHHTYEDMVHQVYLQKYDAAVGDFTITSNRSLYVEFTSPFTDLGLGTVARVDDTKNLWLFLAPLDRALWMTTAAFFILTGFVVWKIENPINEAFQGSRSEQIGTTVWFIMSTLVFAHRENLVSNLSRFVVIIWVFVVLIISSSYTATLSSLLTVQQIELASNRGYYIGTQPDTIVRGIIESNLNLKEPYLRTLSSADQYAEALSRGSRNGGVAAIINEMPYIKIFLGKFPDHHTLVASDSTSSGFGFVFQKGSPLISDISRAIMQLREEGTLERMEHIWFKSDASYSQLSSETSNTRTLKLDSFRGLFMISGTSLTLALIVYYFYLLREQWNWRIRKIVSVVLQLMIRYSTTRYSSRVQY